MPSPLARRFALVVFALSSLGACEVAKPKVVSAQPPASSRPNAGGGGSGGETSTPPPTAPPGISLGDAGAPASGGSNGSSVTVGDGGAPNTVLVYAHSGSDLFRVDPQTLEITRVGPFVVKGPPRDRFLNTVTDIAIDKDGHMTGVTFVELLSIDVATAECKVIAPVSNGSSLNGLSWIRTEGGEEILAATGNNGTILRIDPATGTSTVIGNLAMDQRSSGDLVSVANYGTLITLRGDGPNAAISGGSDLLARIDPVTGAATVIGPTGFKHVYGIGFWGNRVFGFTDTGEFILIDPKTGASKLVQQITAFPFWGAGVSTSAPVTID
jgi:hypothetical protein